MKKAFSGIGFIAFIFIFGLVCFITFEYAHIFTVKESVDTDISRGLNISVDAAMQNIDWINHTSVMNTDVAASEFKVYLRDIMKLDSNNAKFTDDGDFLYQIIIDEEDLRESPAKYSVRGRIRLQPVTVRSILPDRFDIPFSQTSKNTRYDD